MTWAPSPAELALIFFRALDLDAQQGLGTADELDDQDFTDSHHSDERRANHWAGSAGRWDALEGDRSIEQPYGKDDKDADEGYERTSTSTSARAGAAAELTIVERREALAEADQVRDLLQYSGVFKGLKGGISQHHSASQSNRVRTYDGGINDWIGGVEGGVQAESTAGAGPHSKRRMSSTHRSGKKVSATTGSPPSLFHRRQQRSASLPSTSDSPRAVADISLPFPPPHSHDSLIASTHTPFTTPSTEGGPATPNEIPHLHQRQPPSFPSTSYSRLPDQYSHAMHSRLAVTDPFLPPQQENQDLERDEDRSPLVPPVVSLRAHEQHHHIHDQTLASYHYRHLTSPPLFHLSPSLPLSFPLPSKFSGEQQDDADDDNIKRTNEWVRSYCISHRCEGVQHMHGATESNRSVGMADDHSFAKVEGMWHGSAPGAASVTERGSAPEAGLRAADEANYHEAEEELYRRGETPVSAVVDQGINVAPRLSPSTIPSIDHEIFGRRYGTTRASPSAQNMGSGIIDLLERRCQSYLGIQNATFGTRRGSAQSSIAPDAASVMEAGSPSLTKAKTMLDEWELELMNSMLSVGS
ncbi:hypothetical protein DL93DRAFT_2090473 [Clavulina sp. PMI_390]|nr:hypothetical protein DL93DRAFT_2090473 [Clavulina sp. PMI_390]